MQNKSPAYMAALENAVERGLVVRKLVYFTAKRRDNGAPVTRGFWNGEDTLDFAVLNGFSGFQETRTYIGDGSLLDVSELIYVSDLTMQRASITLSQIAVASQQMVREYDMRLAKVEVHEYLLDPDTRLPVSIELPDFLGEVQKAPLKTPAAKSAGSIDIECVSDAFSMLTRSNPRKASYEGHKAARGDEWGLYRTAMETIVNIPWGQK